MPVYYGNYTAYAIDYLISRGINESQVNQADIHLRWMAQIWYELSLLMKFYARIAKSVGFPIGLLVQILAVIFLVRGNSGYSRSARNWFLLVLGADISSVLYRLYDLITVDFAILDINLDSSAENYFGKNVAKFMWGLRRLEDAVLQDVMCRVFFIILYFPIHLSPIALAVSSMIRSYFVKFPLRAKAAFTTRIDRCVMALTVVLSLGVAIVIGAVGAEGWSIPYFIEVFGYKVLYGDCVIPKHEYANTDKELHIIAAVFMMSVIFIICALNLLSALVIIFVLFEAAKARKSLSAAETSHSQAEVRATAKLLGMNATLFVCFFASRLMTVILTRVPIFGNPVAYVVLERLSSYLFDIPYYTNAMFIVGFSQNFYKFYLPCIVQ